MKLILLEVQAFGPFRKNEKVEFSSLGEEPLFLIDGPTGAGKSSILNGITFALYGDLADKDRNNESIRCDFSDDDTETKVSLTFEIRGSIYKITRAPTQIVKKKKGDGLRERPGFAELLKIGKENDEVLVPKKVKEATEKIEEIIGLDRNQFIQVMVLPQGKFRELLLASSEDRQKILSTLFGTKRFKSFEVLLKEKAKEISRKYAISKSKVDEVLKEVDLTFNEIDRLDDLLNEVNKKLYSSKNEKEKAQFQRESASNNLEVGHNILKLFRMFDSKEKEYLILKGRKKNFDLMNEKITFAEEARRLKDFYTDFENSKKKVFDTLKDISNKKEHREISEKKLEDAKLNLNKAENEMNGKEVLLKKEIELNSYLEKTRLLHETVLNFKTASKSYENKNLEYIKLKNGKNECENKIKSFENEIMSLNEHLSSKADLVKNESNLKMELVKRKDLEKIKEDKNKKENLLLILEGDLFKVKNELKNAQYEADTLEMNWYNNQASILAKKLKVNQPCPVCGSLEHPIPAKSESEFIDKKSIDEARSKERKILNKKNEIDIKIGQINSLIINQNEIMVNLKNELGKSSREDVSFFDLRLSSIKLKLKEVEKKEIRLKEIKKEKDKLNQKKEALELSLTELNDNILPQIKEQVLKEKNNLDHIKKLVPKEYYNLDLLNSDIKKNRELIQKIDKNYNKSKREKDIAIKSFAEVNENLKVRANDLKNFKEESDQAQSKWRLELEKSFLESFDAFITASSNIENVSRWREEVRNYEETLNKISGEQVALEKQLKEKVRPDISKLEKEYSEAKLLFKEKEEAWLRADGKKNKLEETKKTVLEGRDSLEKIEEKNKLVGTLASLTAGKFGNAKISLERFVLMDLLDEVLEVASERLHKMSKGQYRLVRWDEEKQNKAVAAGLDLAVDDFYTGKVRPVKTLSGGESFLASLALALALSDIVQRRSGGIQLDTLFIDEGFGSLDQESLQLAIDTLKDLHTSGRSIGIISHVTELKDQIDQRIDVKNSQWGSEISLSLQ